MRVREGIGRRPVWPLRNCVAFWPENGCRNASSEHGQQRLRHTRRPRDREHLAGARPLPSDAAPRPTAGSSAAKSCVRSERRSGWLYTGAINVPVGPSNHARSRYRAVLAPVSDSFFRQYEEVEWSPAVTSIVERCARPAVETRRSLADEAHFLPGSRQDLPMPLATRHGQKCFVSRSAATRWPARAEPARRSRATTSLRCMSASPRPTAQQDWNRTRRATGPALPCGGTPARRSYTWSSDSGPAGRPAESPSSRSFRRSVSRAIPRMRAA